MGRIWLLWFRPKLFEKLWNKMKVHQPNAVFAAAWKGKILDSGLNSFRWVKAQTWLQGEKDMEYSIIVYCSPDKIQWWNISDCSCDTEQHWDSIAGLYGWRGSDQDSWRRCSCCCSSCRLSYLQGDLCSPNNLSQKQFDNLSHLKVLFKRAFGDVSLCQLAMFFSMIGLCSTLFLWPLILTLYFTGAGEILFIF